jgi:uncharacterized protein
MLAKLRKITESEYQKNPNDHGFDHVLRVINLCRKIGRAEGAKMKILLPAAFLHDLGQAEETANNLLDHAEIGAKKAEKILLKLGWCQLEIREIKKAILTHRFRSNYPPETLEAKVLFDADKLDGSGAIGITRGSMWVANQGGMIYREFNLEEYIRENLNGKVNGRLKDRSKHTLHADFETRGRYLPEKLYTKTGRQIAKSRVAFYKMFLERLEEEIAGKQ